MSAVKRKQDASKIEANIAKKRRKTSSDVKVAAKSDHGDSNGNSDTKLATTKSVLSREQPAFPRGGAGPLTLLEKKQIRAQVNRESNTDAKQSDLFANGQSAPAGPDESDIDVENIDVKQPFAVKKSKKNKNKSSAIKDKDSIPIQSVSHKRLIAGSLVLGRVNHLTSTELSIALPNTLVGHLPLSAISKQFSDKLEKALVDEDAEENEEEDDDETDLRKHFRENQMLRVAVVDVEDESNGKRETKKKANLTSDPAVVNKGMNRKLLVPGITIQGAVVSVEDHGVIVDVGLEDVKSGFISESNLPKGVNFSNVRIGAVYLCSVLSVQAKGRTVQLSANLSTTPLVKIAPSVEAFLPGTLAEVLLTHVGSEGLVGKVMGMLDVTADFLHSGSYHDKESFPERFQVGQKVKARLIATFSQDDSKRLAFSILENLVTINDVAEESLELSSIVDRAKVVSVAHGLGIYFTLPSGAQGFAHISRLADKTIDTLSEISGPYKLGTEHQARILDFNPIDGLYVLSLQKSVLEQPFLRLADVKIGAIVTGTVEKILLGKIGVHGLLVRVSAGITGFVSLIHISDTVLKNPEKKYREGMSVKARVLSVDVDRRRLDMTLKKSLVNSDQPVWTSYDDLRVGQATVGTIVKVDPTGAIMQFYAGLKGRLPVSEMSEAFIKDASEHFKVGQVLTVNVLRVDAEARKLILSTRDPESTPKNDTSSLRPGELVTGTVFEKSADDLQLRLEPSGAVARLSLDQVADGSEKKRKSTFDKIRVSQKLEDVLVLEIKGRQVTLSNKASLRKAADEGKLLTSYEKLAEDIVVTGYVSNITADRVFVRFAQGITGVVNKSQLPAAQVDEPDFGMKALQPVSARIVSIDYKGAIPRFWLSMRTADNVRSQNPPEETVQQKEVIEPVDEDLHSYSQLVQGAVFQARITSVKETQVNVEFAKGLQGRVDVSELFDKLEDIHDRKRPTKQFSAKQILKVKIVGQHDSRTYKYLPLSHRSSKNVVFELSARTSVVQGTESMLKLEDIKVDDAHVVFVNNVADHSLMVNVSPAVRGRIKASDVSDNLSLAANLSGNFPVGSALKAKVISIDLEKGRLDLSAKSGSVAKSISLDDVSAGDIVAGRITKITDRSLLVQLSDNVVGAVDLIDLADDFDLADTSRFKKNEIVRAYVQQVDIPNKKLHLSLRSSKILSSALEVKDPEATLEQINIGDIRRGFVVNVADKGIFVTLSRGVTAFVRVTNLSDDYLKEWKEQFQKDQLVTGKVILADKDSGHIQMSLKRSHIDGTYQKPLTFSDLKVGDVVEGRIAKVESFGVFIVVSNSENVRGLCHRSEIAEKRIEDVTKAGFSEGDLVKAKVLKVDQAERRVNLGMKATYFNDGLVEDEDSDVDNDEAEDGMQGIVLDNEADDDDVLDSDDEGGIEVDLDDVADDMEVDDKSSNEVTPTIKKLNKPIQGLSVGGFDWFGMPTTIGTSSKRPADLSNPEEQNTKTKKHKKKPSIQIDHTADLDRDGPQSTDDFERLLLTEPDNSHLWIQFMAFHLDLGDIDAARTVAEKALKSIGIAQETEKQAIWIALLNLENTFGDDESVDATVQRACQTMDVEDMHAKLASIYIQSGKHAKADDLFSLMTRKFTQNPKLWENYAVFLFDTLEQPGRARALLPRALQALPSFTHFDITKRFAMLEFKTKTGVPEEGRTRFQGLVNLYPKRLDLFNVMLDLEMKLGDVDQVRSVFEQVLSKKNLKPAKVKPFFERWLAFEKKRGDGRKVEEVEARAAKWVMEYRKANAGDSL